MKINKSVKEIASLINGQIIGQENIVVKNFSGIKEANNGDISFLSNPKYLPFLKESKASVIIIGKDFVPTKEEQESKVFIKVDNPSLATSVLMSKIFISEQEFKPGVHPSAVLKENVVLGKNVCIEPNAVISSNAKIGENTVIGANVFIGRNVVIGKDCLIYPNVVIREDVAIGDRVYIHSGTVVGSDGFGYMTEAGEHFKIPQIGTVVIEDDVELGANVTIDRARFDKTVIGKGTKIDNLVQIAHNVIVGKHCIIIAQTGIAGSVTIGNHVTIAGQTGTVGHIKIGDRAIIGAQSGVTKDVPSDAKYSGYPAKDHMQERRLMGHIARLPLMQKRIKELEEKIDKILKNN